MEDRSDHAVWLIGFIQGALDCEALVGNFDVHAGGEPPTHEYLVVTYPDGSQVRVIVTDKMKGEVNE